ncbi:MAG TPA: hypothetical protein VF647_19570 [Longimicrobium sp.]|jgi:hypothetical protein
MPRTTLSLSCGALLLALLATPGAAQQRHVTVNNSNWTHTSIDGGQRLEIRATGDVELNDEGDWVESLPAGGRLVVEEEGRGPDRRAEFRPEGSGVRVLYFVDGRERAMDAEGQAWIRRTLGDAAREGGLGAERRVRRIRARRGVGGVLEEIGRVRSDSGRRLYFRALFDGEPMRDDEYARALREVGRIRSDSEKRLVLSGATDAARGGRRLAALLEAAGTIDSDAETRLVLTRVLERHTLEDGDTRQAFFTAVDGIGSDSERRLVLTRLIQRGTPSRAVLVGALRSAGQIRSDAEKRLVLMQVPVARLEDDGISHAFMDVTRTIRSDSERALVLRHLARSGR